MYLCLNWSAKCPNCHTLCFTKCVPRLFAVLCLSSINQQFSVMTSCWCQDTETFYSLLALWEGNPPVTDRFPLHDDVIKWKHFPRYWPFVRGIHRSGDFPAQRPVTRRFDLFFFICARINDWVNNREAGDLRRYRGHYDVTVMHKRLATRKFDVILCAWMNG